MDEPNQNVPIDDDDDEDLCSICLETFTNKALAQDCLHNFCYQCIYSWVQQRPVCPLCLKPIKAIESKLNDTYYLESKNSNNGTLDAGNSADEEVDEEEEETDWDASDSDLDEYDDYSEDGTPDFDNEDSYSDDW